MSLSSISPVTIQRAVTSSVKSTPKGSAGVSENQRDKNGHSKGDLSKLPNDGFKKLPDEVFNMLPEKYLSPEDMARLSCVSKEKQSDLKQFAKRANTRLRKELKQKISQTEIVGIQISPGPFRNDIQEISVLQTLKKSLPTAITVLKANNITNINEMKWRMTPLYIAASMGNAKLVDALIVAGADVNKANVYECTPLYKAASNGDKKVVDVLIAGGANVNVSNKLGRTPLHWAASNGPATVVKALVIAGADVNVKDKYGLTALHEAADKGNEEIVKALVKAGADVNAKESAGFTALHYAVLGGFTDIVIALVIAGADVNATNNDGETVLHWATKWGYYNVKKAIEEGKKKLISLYKNQQCQVNSPIHLQLEDLEEPLLQNAPEKLNETQKKQAIKYSEEEKSFMKKYFWYVWK